MQFIFSVKQWEIFKIRPRHPTITILRESRRPPTSKISKNLNFFFYVLYSSIIQEGIPKKFPLKSVNFSSCALLSGSDRARGKVLACRWPQQALYHIYTAAYMTVDINFLRIVRQLGHMCETAGSQQQLHASVQYCLSYDWDATQKSCH